MDEHAKPKAPKGRSPSYPGISLKTAVDRAKQLYEHSKGHALPKQAITDAWGYKSPRSGPASVTYAALKKFGLLEEEGSGDDRVGKLSDLALDILMNPDPASFIKASALKPEIHREMWREYGQDLPPDSALKYELVRKRGFTENGFSDFIREYRETIAFAQLSTSDRVEDTDGPPNRPSSDVSQPPGGVTPARNPGDPSMTGGVNTLVNPPADQKVYAIPVGEGEDVLVTFPGQVTPDKWETFMAILNAMKEPILRARKPSNEPGESYE